MCMINKNDLVEVNKRFDNGNIVNMGSLEFILSTLKHSKDWVTQLAYILRGILIDHIFEEGNKRTALAVMLVYFEANKKAYDVYKAEKIITEILLKNIKDINKIRRMIKNVIWQ